MSLLPISSPQLLLILTTTTALILSLTGNSNDLLAATLALLVAFLLIQLTTFGRFFASPEFVYLGYSRTEYFFPPYSSSGWTPVNHPRLSTWNEPPSFYPPPDVDLVEV